MNDKQLKKTLQSVGMTCFVKYFRLFANLSLSDDYVTRQLLKSEEWDESAARGFRVRGARRIIRAGGSKDALKLISESKRLAHLRPCVDSLLREV